MPKENYILSDKQKDEIIRHWDASIDLPPSISDLIQLVCPANKDGSFPDGRSKEGQAIKEFLASKALKARTVRDPRKRPTLILSDEQKEYVDNNHHTMKAYEMAEELFNKKPMTNLSYETRGVLAYLKEKGAEAGYKIPGDRTDVVEEWKPPRKDCEAVAKVKAYAEKLRKDFVTTNLTPIERKNINSLLEFMRTVRFKQQMNTYESEQERELFESTFVRLTWTKPDLLPEEVDEYIVYAGEVVNGSNIMRQIEKLRKARDDEMEESKKVPMAIVEAVAKTQAEYNNCLRRQDTILKALKQTRAQRMQKSRDESATLGNLVALWKAEETRKQMMEVAEKRKANQKEEYDKIKTIDDIKSRMIGLTENEALYG